MRGRKIISLILAIATLIFIIACLMFYNTSQTYKAEKGIEEAIKAYSASMEESEIKVLTREINDAVEKKLSEMNTEELTEEDLKELLETVVKELETRTVEYRDTDITQEEINNIANEVIKKIIDLKIIPSNEEELAKLEAYKLQLDQITRLHQELSAKLTQTRTDITNLENKISGLTLNRTDITNLENKINELAQARTDITNLEKKIAELEKALKDRMEEIEDKAAQLEDKAAQLEDKAASMEGNMLYYDYDQGTQTLKMYGKKGN